jgi:hypothetical protein
LIPMTGLGSNQELYVPAGRFGCQFSTRSANDIMLPSTQVEFLALDFPRLLAPVGFFRYVRPSAHQGFRNSERFAIPLGNAGFAAVIELVRMEVRWSCIGEVG